MSGYFFFLVSTCQSIYYFPNQHTTNTFEHCLKVNSKHKELDRCICKNTAPKEDGNKSPKHTSLHLHYFRLRSRHFIILSIKKKIIKKNCPVTTSRVRCKQKALCHSRSQLRNLAGITVGTETYCCQHSSKVQGGHFTTSPYKIGGTVGQWTVTLCSFLLPCSAQYYWKVRGSGWPLRYKTLF